jgi:hypothetical protein
VYLPIKCVYGYVYLFLYYIYTYIFIFFARLQRHTCQNPHLHHTHCT